MHMHFKAKRVDEFLRDKSSDDAVARSASIVYCVQTWQESPATAKHSVKLAIRQCTTLGQLGPQSVAGPHPVERPSTAGSAAIKQHRSDSYRTKQ